ncbi:hypothetical protein ACFLSZ_06500 [Candidatus Bipolaricaulota bacterium]
MKLKLHRMTPLSIPQALRLRICLFWGLPCRVPISRMNDDRLYIRACAIAKRKFSFFQKLWINACMLPIVLFMCVSQNKKALCLMLYLLPVVFVGAISWFIGELISRFSISYDVYVRREYKRLQERAQQLAVSGSGSPTFALATAGRNIRSSGVTQRVWDHKRRCGRDMHTSNIRSARRSRGLQGTAGH